GGNGSCCSGGCEFVLNVISSVHPMDRKKKTPVVHHTERVVNSLVSTERKVLRSIGVLSTWSFSMVLHGITGQIHKGIFQGGTLERELSQRHPYRICQVADISRGLIANQHLFSAFFIVRGATFNMAFFQRRRKLRHEVRAHHVIPG